MNNQFKPIQLLNDISDSAKSGQLQVTANSVIWKLYFSNGKLQYATHSLQSWEIIKYHLLYLGYNNATEVEPLNYKQIFNHDQLIEKILTRSVREGNLDPIQKENLMAQLTEDAFESFLCLTQGQEKWYSSNEIQPLKIPNLTRETLLELPSLISNLQIRLQKWQKLKPFIVSPHQRPYCPNPSLIQQSILSQTIPQTISQNLFLQLVKLMRGISLRQLAIFVKQDELKLAQLLLPYIKRSILKTYPPKSPLDKLPLFTSFLLDNSQPDSKINNEKETTSTATIIREKPTTSLQSAQKKYQVACIDDSPIMPETIQEYLGTEKYQLIGITNPMKATSSLFKNKPDLILMDISMPGINGNRLCKILKASPLFKEVPIILVSGNTKLLNQETITGANATDFLPKPFTKKSLLNIVEKHL